MFGIRDAFLVWCLIGSHEKGFCVHMHLHFISLVLKRQCANCIFTIKLVRTWLDSCYITTELEHVQEAKTTGKLFAVNIDFPPPQDPFLATHSNKTYKLQLIGNSLCMFTALLASDDWKTNRGQYEITLPSLGPCLWYVPHTSLYHCVQGFGCAVVWSKWLTAASGAAVPPSETPWASFQTSCCQTGQGNPSETCESNVINSALHFFFSQCHSLKTWVNPLQNESFNKCA